MRNIVHYSIENMIGSTPEQDLNIFIKKNSEIKESYKYIIGGAGIAGLYAAYKILMDDKETSILIIEKSFRTGGRLDSDNFMINDSQIKEEEGGMRLTFEDMPHLINLIIELNLEKDIVPFPMHIDDNNRLFFRGKSFSKKDSYKNNNEIWSKLFNLDQQESFIKPSEIIPLVYKQIVGSSENIESKKVLDLLNQAHTSNISSDETDYIEHVEHEGKKIKVSLPAIWQFFRLNFKWEGVELYKWTLWSLLASMKYSDECINMMARTSGFSATYFSNMNAGEAFQLLMEFSGEPDFKSLKYGFTQLTNALVEKLNTFSNVKIALNSSLDVILPDNNVSFTHETRKFSSLEKLLELLDGAPNSDQLNFLKNILRNTELTSDADIYKILKPFCEIPIIKNIIDEYLDHSPKILKYENLILALPRVALEKLFNASNGLRLLSNNQGEKIWNNLQTTTNQPLAKINLYYENAWWDIESTGRESVSYGPSLTDLPLGSVYPFYTLNDDVNKKLYEIQKFVIDNKDHPKELPDNLKENLLSAMSENYKKPAALTIYCGFQNVNFWQGLMHGESYPQSDKVKLRLKDNITQISLNSKYILPATVKMVNIITEYFKQLFNTHNISLPLATSVRIWEGSSSLKTDAYGDFGYGVHQWGLNSKDDDVIRAMVQPIEELPIYTCGEAYSDFQGWAEGSLRSTNLVLAQLKLKTSTEFDEKKLLKKIRDMYQENLKLVM